MRSLAAIGALALIQSSCVNGDLSTGAHSALGIALVPSFQVDPSTFDADPIDRIRIRAFDVDTDEVVAVVDQTVDPASTEWVLQLSLDLDGASSREVLLEAELFTAGAVTWSGRLGPLDASPSISSALTAIDIFPGPLDNFEVLSVTVDNAPTELLVGQTGLATGTATVPTGSDANPQLFWASLDPTVATVVHAGGIATITGVSPGTATIQAAAGPQFAEVMVDIQPVSGGGEILWVGGSDANPTDWFANDNWSPVGVPGIEDVVRIPPTNNDPVLIASFQILDLTVDEAVSVDMGGLSHSVLGDLVVTGAMTNGNVIVTGSNVSLLEGGLIDQVTVQEARTLSGGLVVTSLLVADVPLTVGANSLIVGQDLVLQSFPGTATLVMNDAASLVDVGGDARFVAGDHEGLLTAGTLNIGGDLLAGANRFVATGSHRTVFDGASPQVIDLGTAGPAGARFQELELSSVAVALVTDAYVSGDLTVTGELTVGSGLTMDVAGEIILEPGSVLTVDGTLTAGAGCTDNGADISGIGVNVCQPVPATWIGGDATDPVAFENAANWSTSTAPGRNDNVLIPVTANDPIFTGGSSFALGSIVIEDGATLNLGGNRLDLEGDARTGSGGIVNGTVRFLQSSVVEGTMPELVTRADLALSGNLLVEGGFVISDGEVDVGLHLLTIEADLTITGVNGGLRMNATDGVVDVAGDASFTGGQHVGLLTAGTLSLQGNLQGGGLSTAFAASGDHTTVFNGTAEQTINLSNPGTVTHRFHHVQFDNGGAGVRFITDVYAMGSVTVASGATVDGIDDTLAFAGFLDDPAGGLTIANLEIVGATTTIPGTIDADLGIFSDYVMVADLIVNGNVLLNNNDLFVGANRLDVGNDFTSTGPGAQLFMSDPAGIVDIEGSVFFSGASQTTQLSAGEVRVAGDFTVTGSATAFGATGGHTVVFDGPTTQTVTHSSPGAAAQHFHNVTIGSGAGVAMGSDLFVMGALIVPASGSVNGPTQTLSVGGAFSDGSDGIQIQEFSIVGDLTAMDNVSSDVTVRADFTAPSGFFVGGDLTVLADFDIGTSTISASQDLNIFGAGRLIMAGAASAMLVDGDAYFEGGSHVGALTDGLLEVGSSLFVSGDPRAFAASGSHTTEFPNTGLSVVNFDQPGATLQAFQNLTVNTIDNALEFVTDVVVLGDFIVGGDATVDGSDDVLSVGGSFQASGGFADLAELVIIGDLTALTGSLDFDVRVGSDYTFPAPLTVGGDLRIEGARLDLGGFRHTVNGDLEVLAAGLLGMTTVGDTLNLLGDTLSFAGSALFAGGSHSGLLTEGVINLTGDLDVTGSALAFVSSGNHQVRFMGFLPQRVNFSDPGVATQRLNDVDVRNFSGSVDLETDAFVMGFFDFDDGDMSRTGPVGTMLELRGTMRLAESTFIGLPVALESPSGVASHSMSLVTFTAMDGTDTQLRLRLPGSGQFPGLTGDDVTFDDVLTTGVFVDVSSNNGMPWVFQMGGTPFPATPPTGSFITDLIASVVWPWP